MTQTDRKESAGSTWGREAEADRIVHGHMMWAMGAGVMPIPLFDIAAVTAVQMDMLNHLARLYGVDYTNAGGKTFVGALTGSTFAHIGASMLKFIPGIGTVFGGISMAAMSGASTYAVGAVARSYFLAGRGVSSIDAEEARRRYEEEFEHGKDVASDLESQMKGDNAKYRKAFEAIQKLRDLQEQELLTEEEFEQMKKTVLEKL